ncbi:peptidase domain-containing ABC transporter [Mucilaginibacter sp. BT774]|uniref:peptidase domain-containing ABC transporter n=1 Tax=Mucilaginibacter sp. BT774 TaxID=3062276 RepID=UPI002676BA86|nr:peptidase domain-containing ABC transporter [Mucilaginibacter sp. BT774]MDO3627172.1 peptidase domain-containing ABC transporter [Mucilaginibacter sp. BT774]
MSFPFYKQYDQMDCGPSCLKMIAKYFGHNYQLQTLRDLCGINREGVSLLGISQASEKMGFRSLAAKITAGDLDKAELPCILHWRQNHFVVLYKIKGNKYYIADPASGMETISEQDFIYNWIGDHEQKKGIALLLSPMPEFYQVKDEKRDEAGWSYLIRYFVAYRKHFLQLLLGLGIGSFLQLIAPIMTQSVVDIGINTRNLNFIYLILIAQAVLIIGRVSVEFIRSWILLYISTRINISILTDFLIKLMKLPISFFDTKMTGDIMQRMNDQRNIQTFLTGSTLTTLFSMFNLVVFSIVLVYYNFLIFFVFAISSTLYIGWIAIFLRSRRRLNYQSFDISAKNQSAIVQLIGGMQEIKLNNYEQEKRWEWEHIQARLFKFSLRNLALSQYQQGGSTFINEGTNLLITFLSAKAVIDGNLTLGGMLAVQYIIGQLNAPIQQLLAFMQGFQDAKISLERLNEIQLMSDEEPLNREWNSGLPENKSLSIRNLTFRYPGTRNEPVLENINLDIPDGKTTAIVGMSGSGKTTILKLLLRFYEPENGDILVDDQSISNISFKSWRAQCGVVMQEGFIFSETIEKNITLGDEYPDRSKLLHAIRTANIQDFINKLPLGLKTKIGAEGNGISQGQKQRMLIARAIYKDPHFIFFDEATNALDANNESIIMNNLNDFFKGRTVVIVAHRLSTVTNADNIVVLDKGRIIEQGTHEQLTSLRGAYYGLVKNQLELGT